MSNRNTIAKFLLAFILVFSVLMPAQPQEAEAASPVSVYVNGQQLPAKGEIINGYTVVPMRAIFESLGAQVGWFPQTRTISAYDPQTNKIMSLVVDQKNMFCADNSEFAKYESNPTSQAAINFVLENTQIITVPPTIKNGSTLVPARVISEALNCQVGWNGATRTVTINR